MELHMVLVVRDTILLLYNKLDNADPESVWRDAFLAELYGAYSAIRLSRPIYRTIRISH
ncbi:MAG: hypothetical protein IT392_12415 [Nitrospirae bacterium]|nr:hypothetical protein [Nitrospirota bacterium]